MADDRGQFEDRLAAYRAFRDLARQGGLAPAVAEAERVSRRRRRIVFACIGVAILILVGSCSVVRLTMLPERQARAVVLSYLEALSDPVSAWPAVEREVVPEVVADLPQVQGSDGTSEPAVRRQLIGSSVLPQTRCLGPGVGTHTRGPVSKPTGCYTPPSDPTVTDVAVGDNEAVVSVTYGFEGDDQRHTASLRLRRDTGPVGIVLARWRILDAFGTLDLSPAGGSGCQLPEATSEAARCVTLDGFPAADIAGLGTRPTVLPGRHQVEVHLWNSLTGWQSAVFTAVVAPGAEVAAEPVT